MFSVIDATASVPRFRTVPNTRTAAAERRRREQELRQALTAGELALAFLGQVWLASGEVGAAEAIIRWPHRRRGLAPVAEFMPLAESAGLSGQVGSWALRPAWRWAVGWGAGAVAGADVAGDQLTQDSLLDQVAAALESAGLPPERLELDLSEQALVGCSDEHLLRLAVLRDLGVGIALDQFGAGAASLSLLRRLPLTTVKLDASMLRDITVCQEDRAILQAVIQVAHGLGLLAVATGVETEDQCAVLSGMACDAACGPLFGAPFPPGWSGQTPRRH